MRQMTIAGIGQNVSCWSSTAGMLLKTFCRPLSEMLKRLLVASEVSVKTNLCDFGRCHATLPIANI